MSNIIELNSVSKVYELKKKRISALESISLNVEKGSFVAIMGPSGCGKSTLMKIIAGIEKPSQGSLVIDGVSCNDGVSREMQQRFGYVFQWHNLMDWLTVEKNLYLPFKMFGWKEDRIWKERADKYLKLVGLSEYRHVFPHELSGGMKQRAGIARSLMMEPDILLLDQPFGALDAITRKMISKSIYELQRETKRTAVMVTSNISEAIRMADKVCIMTNAPGQIKKVIDIDIPHEQRGPELEDNERFMELQLEIIALIKETQKIEEEAVAENLK